MRKASSRSEKQSASSDRAGNASILCPIQDLGAGTKGADEAQLCFFPFVTEPDWYELYWYQQNERPNPVFRLSRHLAHLIKALCSAKRSDAPAFASCDPQIARGWTREA